MDIDIKPVTAVLDLGGKLIDRLWPDPAQRDAAKLQLLQLHQSGELQQMAGQVDINKIEAASSSVFVAGWRPFVGWTCGAGLAMQFVVGPTLTWAAALLGRQVAFPTLDMGTLLTLLFGLLGLGYMRTQEKLSGAAK
jgi:hypothetical protein